MALANFFDKMHLGASQLLKNYDRSGFEAKLLSLHVAISFTAQTAKTAEGHVTLHLLTRLLARLYPVLSFHRVDDENDVHAVSFEHVARAINPVIELDSKLRVTHTVVVGIVDPDAVPDGNVMFIGSQEWSALFSCRSPQPIGISSNPFGAAFAACLGTANLFRLIFGPELNHPLLDQDVAFSVFEQKIHPLDNGPSITAAPRIDVTLVGAGAIGNAMLWTLANLQKVQGHIAIIDPQAVASSNLQRYIWMGQADKDLLKVDVLGQYLREAGFTVTPYPFAWQEVMLKLSPKEQELIAVALDTGEERLLLQSALPRKIVNGWTSPDCLGVSRHPDFLQQACLSCLYMPSEKRKSESQKIAIALNIEHQEPTVRHYLAMLLPIDDFFIQLVSAQGGLDREKLELFRGQSVYNLYNNGICGGRVISINSHQAVAQDMEVPLAHESAMAGVLLAAEVVIENLGLRSTAIPPLTKINLMQPLHNHLLEEEEKHYSGRCLCQDEIFRGRYREKWILSN